MPPPPLTPPEAALARILEVLAPLPEASVPVEAAVGRALGADVLAKRTLPPWDNSAVDGYAVRAGDAAQRPGGRLRVTQTVFAGSRPAEVVGPGEAARIMTGAPVPPGADAVVMQERAERLGEEVRLHEVPVPGQMVRRAGEDATAGALLLPAGRVLGIPEAALLWAQGIMEVKVPRRPTVAILASGDELCRPEDAQGDRIVDTNSPQLALCAARAGGVPRLLGVARDDPDALTALIEQALEADVVLTSAGVSVGDRDFVHEALRRLGVTVHFWRVAIKPGKPLLFGSRGKTAIFGLPGNPASSLVTFELFVRPALQRLLGHPAPGWRWVPGRSLVPLRKPPGLTHYVRATAQLQDGALWASPLDTQTSGAVRSVAGAEYLIVLPAELERCDAGDPVSLLPVTWGA